jgi:anti-sigma regulatory factor (Ser/Thr protein kinase)
MRTAIFSARFDQLDAIRGFAAQAARDAAMDDAEVYAVGLATDEACTNIIEHAYGGEGKGIIECTCDSDDTRLTVIIRDHGKPFDPSTLSEPDIEADIEDRSVGGLGVFLMKRLMDEVHFEPLGETGNVLTMVKRRKQSDAGSWPGAGESAWRHILVLGEELIRMGSLAIQRDLIVNATAHLLNGQAELWLDEAAFRLPGSSQTALFPPEPPNEPMREVFKSGLPFIPKRAKTLLVFPLKNGGVIMGTLQVTRSASSFRKREIEILEGLAGHVSLALVTSHRSAVEQWRTEQLTLVRRVSAQIANVLDMDELTRRVTKLIQRTFNYYYVAVFTHELGRSCCASVRAPDRVAAAVSR